MFRWRAEIDPRIPRKSLKFQSNRLLAIIPALGLTASVYVGCMPADDASYDAVMTEQALGDGLYGGYGDWPYSAPVDVDSP
jgi:hypothetical protein